MYPSAARPYFGSFVRSRRCALSRHSAHRPPWSADRGEHGSWLAVCRKYLSLFGRTIVVGLRTRPDVIHAHYIFPTSLPAVPLAKWLGIPLVATAHRGDVFEMPYRSRLHFALTKLCLSHCTRVIAVSAEIRAKLRADFDVSDDRIEVIDMGFEARPVDSEAAIHEFVTVTFVGLSFERKGGPTLLKAIAAMDATIKQRARFVFIGEFPSSELTGARRDGRRSHRRARPRSPRCRSWSARAFRHLRPTVPKRGDAGRDVGSDVLRRGACREPCR